MGYVVNLIKGYLIVFLRIRIWIRIRGFRILSHDLKIKGLELSIFLRPNDKITNDNKSIHKPTNSDKHITQRILCLKKQQVSFRKYIIDT